MTRAVRGAILVGKNEQRVIYDAALRLVREMMKLNGMREEDIISAVFSMTADLDAGNPATGIREAGFAETPFFCVQEAKIHGGMARVIRALVTYEGQSGRKPVAVYLDGAEALRPDIRARRAQ
ncbi:MAG: chorismate mutase [Spirochaetia bacterium]|jgi:chorismate mutase